MMRQSPRTLGTLLLAAVLLTAAAAPAPALDIRGTPDQQVTGALQTALLAYRDQLKQWPKSIQDLQTFASQRGRPLDLRAFSRITLTRKSSESVYVAYVTKAKQPGEGGFAVTVIDVR